MVLESIQMHLPHRSPSTMQGLMDGKQANRTGSPWPQGAYLLTGKTRHRNVQQINIKRIPFAWLPSNWDIGFLLPSDSHETPALPGSQACQPLKWNYTTHSALLGLQLANLEDLGTCQPPWSHSQLLIINFFLHTHTSYCSVSVETLD